MLKLIIMAYTTIAEELPVLSVSLRPHFTNNWRRGRYAHDPEIVADHFNEKYKFGYLDRKNRDHRRSGVLRFPGQRLAITVYPDGSEASVEANSFYHERAPFQLGRKKMKLAEIGGAETRPGIVNVSWKTMY